MKKTLVVREDNRSEGRRLLRKKSAQSGEESSGEARMEQEDIGERRQQGKQVAVVGRGSCRRDEETNDGNVEVGRGEKNSLDEERVVSYQAGIAAI